MNIMDIKPDAEIKPDVDFKRLSVGAHEETLGVVGLLAITHKRVTIVIAEDNEGIFAVGTNASWPDQDHRPRYGLALARDRALRNLEVLQDKRDEHLRKAGR